MNNNSVYIIVDVGRQEEKNLLTNLNLLIIGVFHGMAPMARAIAEAVEKS